MISVVIPCRNGAGVLAKQLDALSTQETSAEFEIVVADNGSTDGTADLVRAHPDPRVRVVDAGRAPGVNVARNVGITASKAISFCSPMRTMSSIRDGSRHITALS